MPSKKILFDLRTVDAHFPGISRFAYELAMALQRHPSQPQLTAVIHKGARTDLDLQALEQSMRVVLSDAAVFGVQQHLWMPWLAWRMRPDVAIFPYYVRPLWMPCPSLTILYDTIAQQVPEVFSRLKRWQIVALHRLAIKGSSAIATISQSASEDFGRWYGIRPQSTVVLTGAAGKDFWPRPTGEIDAIRKRYGLPQRYVLFVASDKPHKNIPFLLRCWQQAQTGTVGLVLGGRWTNPDTAQLLDHPALSGRVWRIPDVPEAELPALYSGALAFAFPSRYEGFGLPAIESIACGTPALVSDRASLPEVVGDAGVVLPLEENRWIAAIEQICTDSAWLAALEANTATQNQRFSWDLSAERLLQHLDSI